MVMVVYGKDKGKETGELRQTDQDEMHTVQVDQRQWKDGQEGEDTGKLVKSFYGERERGGRRWEEKIT